MQNQSIQSELRDFVQFATSRVQSGGDRLPYRTMSEMWSESFADRWQVGACCRQQIARQAQANSTAINLTAAAFYIQSE